MFFKWKKQKEIYCPISEFVNPLFCSNSDYEWFNYSYQMINNVYNVVYIALRDALTPALKISDIVKNSISIPSLINEKNIIFKRIIENGYTMLDKTEIAQLNNESEYDYDEYLGFLVNSYNENKKYIIEVFFKNSNIKYNINNILKIISIIETSYNQIEQKRLLMNK